MHRRSVVILSSLVVLVILAGASVPIAQAAPMPQVTSTAVNWCPATASPTAPYPTFVFPTFAGFPTVAGTATPCANGLCPSTSTPTATATNTPTATVTATQPVGVGLTCTVIAGNDNLTSCEQINAYTVKLTQLPSASEGNRTYGLTSASSATWYFRLNVPAGGLWWCYGYDANENVTLRKLNAGFVDLGLDYQVPAGYGTVQSSGGNVWVQGPFTGGQYEWSKVKSAAMYRVGTGRSWIGSPQYLTGYNHTFTMFVSTVPIVSTPTPTATVPACVPGGGSIIESELVSFNGGATGAGYIKPGACYTIVPQMTIAIPQLVHDASPYALTDIGVQGVEFCTQYWSMDLKVFGFDAFSFLAWIANAVCLIVLVREFRS